MIRKYKVVPFVPSWFDAQSGWLNGALSYAETVPEGEAHVGYFTDADVLPNGTSAVLNSFEIHHGEVIMSRHGYQTHITPFEVKVFDIVKQQEVAWSETYGRYMDGIKPVWFKESANINFKFKIEPHLMPVNRASFFRKTMRDLRALHAPTSTSPEVATLTQFNGFLQALNIDSRRLVAPLIAPDAQLTEPMVALCHELNLYQDGSSINVAQARKMMIALAKCWFFATGRLTPSSDHSSFRDGKYELLENIEAQANRYYPNPSSKDIK